MNFTLSHEDLLASSKHQADVLIVLLTPATKVSDNAGKGVQAAIAQAMQAKHFTAEKGKSLALYQAKGWAAPRVLLLGRAMRSPSKCAKRRGMRQRPGARSCHLGRVLCPASQP